VSNSDMTPFLLRKFASVCEECNCALSVYSFGKICLVFMQCFEVYCKRVFSNCQWSQEILAEYERQHQDCAEEVGDMANQIDFAGINKG
jgi:hypothetical protein